MPSFRRFYFYFASALSLLLFLSGGISLARLLFTDPTSFTPTNNIALAVTYILVGLVSLVSHWSLVQRRLIQHPGETASPERAVFLYSLLLVTLFTAILNVLALLDQLLLRLLGVPVELGLLGDGQTLTELLAIILLCSLVAGYFFYVLQQDTIRIAAHAGWQRVRQGYRYSWLLFSLGLLLIGLQQTIQYILQISFLSDAAERAALANGLAFIVVAAPLWVIFERSIQKDESSALPETGQVRLTFNAGIYLILTVSLLFCLAAVVSFTLLATFTSTLADWLVQITLPLSIALPLAAVWVTYQRKLNQELGTALLDPDRAFILRTLRYSFAWLALVTAFAGFQMLIANLINLAVADFLFDIRAWSTLQATQIARAIPAIAIGLPIWLTNWSKISRQARLDNEIGGLSQIQRVRQLYLNALFLVGLVSILVSAGWFIYLIARTILDGRLPFGLLGALSPLIVLIISAILLAYHFQLLQADQRQNTRHRSRRYALFPVLILAPESPTSTGTIQDSFGVLVAAALEREMPGLPIAIHAYTSGAPDDTLSAAKAVIMSSKLLTKPPESILLWLQGYSGVKLVIPESTRDWQWPGVYQTPAYLARLAARKIRGLAENNASPRA